MRPGPGAGGPAGTSAGASAVRSGAVLDTVGPSVLRWCTVVPVPPGVGAPVVAPTRGSPSRLGAHHAGEAASDLPAPAGGSASFGEQAHQVVAVAALAQRLGGPREAVVVQPAVAPGDLLDAADL